MTFITNAILPLAHLFSARSAEGTLNNAASASASPRSSFSLGTFQSNEKARPAFFYTLFLNEAKELVFEAESSIANSQDQLIADGRPLAYRARVELATCNELEITLREAGSDRAILQGNRTSLQLQTEDDVFNLRELDRGVQLLAQHTTYSWVVTTGLAFCVCLATQKPVARLQFRPFGRDRLCLTGEGLEMEPALLVTAAKLWFEHEAQKSFR